MASNFKLSSAARNAACNTIVDLIDVGGAGSLSIYDGAQPASPSEALGAQTLLAQFNLATSAFGPATDGAALLELVDSTTALADGTASWFRLCDGAGTAIADGKVGTSTADLLTSFLQWNTGAIVQVGTMRLTVPNG
jgi:hypothetical protein